MDGLTYNVNADHAALKMALALGSSSLVFVTNVEGVMAGDEVLSRLTPSRAKELIGDGKIYGGMKVDQAKRLKELEAENARLKRAVADLTVDKRILKEVAEGKY